MTETNKCQKVWIAHGNPYSPKLSVWQPQSYSIRYEVVHSTFQTVWETNDNLRIERSTDTYRSMFSICAVHLHVDCNCLIWNYMIQDCALCENQNKTTYDWINETEDGELHMMAHSPVIYLVKNLGWSSSTVSCLPASSGFFLSVLSLWSCGVLFTGTPRIEPCFSPWSWSDSRDKLRGSRRLAVWSVPKIYCTRSGS